MDRMAMRDDMMGITKEALRFCREWHQEFEEVLLVRVSFFHAVVMVQASWQWLAAVVYSGLLCSGQLYFVVLCGREAGTMVYFRDGF
ncbi:hypothetical protein VTJ04DRAFT_6949 [Mycothermus thermophilus]|uniref:uncharacterized protein n=1 Tax=Humicola insolens TaxID=85995 RepID=UPI003744A165